jgi:chromosomal replication initiation ATPase DnaA
VLGSPGFVARLRGLAAGAAGADPLAPEARQLFGLDPDGVCAAVAGHYEIDPTSLQRQGDAHIARAVAAWLCRRHTEAPMRELAARFG